MVERNQIVGASKKTFHLFIEVLPIFLSILLFISLYVTIIPKSFYSQFFTNNPIIDSLLGAVFGSVSTGHPVTSYIIGGELLKAGIPLVAVVAFILSWVTVGIIQLPAECYFLGKRFGITRNIFSFLFSIVISILVVFTLRLL